MHWFIICEHKQKLDRETPSIVGFSCTVVGEQIYVCYTLIRRNDVTSVSCIRIIYCNYAYFARDAYCR